jgi:hypothetical protein
VLRKRCLLLLWTTARAGGYLADGRASHARQHANKRSAREGTSYKGAGGPQSQIWGAPRMSSCHWSSSLRRRRLAHSSFTHIMRPRRSGEWASKCASSCDDQWSCSEWNNSTQAGKQKP